MKRHQRYYSARPRSPHSLSLTPIPNPQFSPSTTFQSFSTCTPCRRSIPNPKYKPPYILITHAQQYLKQSIKCNLSKFLLTKIKILSNKNQKSLTLDSERNKKSTELTGGKQKSKKRIAEPYLLNYKEKLQRIIMRRDQNQEKYKELCMKIDQKIGRKVEELRSSKKIKSKKVLKHRRNLSEIIY